MIHDEVLRALRLILDADETKLAEVVALADPTFDVTPAQLTTYLTDQEDPAHQPVPDALLVRLLDGVVLLRRGRYDTRPQRPFERAVTNNLVLKKLRVAFELKEADLHDLLKTVEVTLSKPELSALFRAPKQKNYRNCPDGLLRSFLLGLSKRVS